MVATRIATALRRSGGSGLDMCYRARNYRCLAADPRLRSSLGRCKSDQLVGAARDAGNGGKVAVLLRVLLPSVTRSKRLTIALSRSVATTDSDFRRYVWVVLCADERRSLSLRRSTRSGRRQPCRVTQPKANGSRLSLHTPLRRPCASSLVTCAVLTDDFLTGVARLRLGTRFKDPGRNCVLC